mmetsp:Transcript_77864/g.166998  ORF Transcript_77864/g.166998 Transcript_77864/m.166998 type:complete len:581 (-) Transcript_77864:232-1974(-)
MSQSKHEDNVAWKVDLQHVAGEVFSWQHDPSDKAVLWGELFKDSERRFLQKELKSEVITFAIRDTFQIHVKTLFQPEARQVAQNKERSYREGRFVLFLHAQRGELTSSWTWSKLVKPFFQRGFSVIMMDWPGFGRSSVNMSTNCHLSVWKYQDWSIVTQVLENLQVQKVHLLACGDSCGVFIRMLQRTPHMLEKEHILHDPVWDIDAYWPSECPPGAAATWPQVKKARQMEELTDTLRFFNARLWCTFTQDEGAEESAVRSTFEIISEVAAKASLMDRINVSKVTREDICGVQIGAKVPLHFFFISKQLRQCYTEFLESRSSKAPLFETNAPTSARGAGVAIDEPATASLGLAAPSGPRRKRGVEDHQREGTKDQSNWGGSSTSGRPPIAPSAPFLPSGGSLGLVGVGSYASPSFPRRPESAFSNSVGQLNLSHTAGSLASAASTLADMNSCTKVAVGTLHDDPKGVRRRLLSKCPPHQRPIDVEAMKPPVRHEPDFTQKERLMMEEAIDDSMHTYVSEQSARLRSCSSDGRLKSLLGQLGSATRMNWKSWTMSRSQSPAVQQVETESKNPRTLRHAYTS